MKKILFLMLIMGVFSPLINAYEYEVYYNPNLTYDNKFIFITDATGHLRVKRFGAYLADSSIYGIFYNIEHNGVNFINKSKLSEYYKNDLIFLNDLYTTNLTIRNAFFNYLYNYNRYSPDDYIYYENYELLYNDDGLAVESIVDGVWAGLYDDSQKSKSGALYNKNGSMVYYNGKEVTPVVSFFVWLQKFTNKVVIETFEEIQRSLVAGIIAAVVLVLAIVRLVLELLPSSITPRRRRYYGGGRGSLSDYGDGAQVAASVRARLAAKNRALKARAYDRSGVEQSLVNGILFDLENDR